MIVVSIFLENVLQPEMEEEFVKLTEVVLKFESKKIFNFNAAITFGSCFFLKLFPAIRCNLLFF
ncbi:hypothetical protein SAMN05444395_11271 [Flavobacterium fryxellicola]|uniref:Uncharacterized protein n=1 Tax=Flavobacterium fryxellicola TaxID=249352 RepID=A0A167XCA2_9FLAO|nr:hypothetical protein FBFR_10260 [Flavobacterium fryxellicola]SHN78155.1 hypothetical protein SAMN05444395_11271 [Flavobacterium fryxellicola]